MKFYHNKTNIGNDDVKYVIIQTGQKLTFKFLKVDKTFNNIPLFQGVKFWLNRCKLKIDNQIILADKIIIWFNDTQKKSTLSNGHFNIYTDTTLILEITDTIDENPNLGIFNIWTSDNKRCYEFTNNSFIKQDKAIYNAGHGWTENNNVTLQFSLT